jgi:hypothetical protein
MANYSDKYLKYKSKYNKLKYNLLIGGLPLTKAVIDKLKRDGYTDQEIKRIAKQEESNPNLFTEKDVDTMGTRLASALSAPIPLTAIPNKISQKEINSLVKLYGKDTARYYLFLVMNRENYTYEDILETLKHEEYKARGGHLNKSINITTKKNTGGGALQCMFISISDIIYELYGCKLDSDDVRLIGGLAINEGDQFDETDSKFIIFLHTISQKIGIRFLILSIEEFKGKYYGINADSREDVLLAIPGIEQQEVVQSLRKLYRGDYKIYPQSKDKLVRHLNSQLTIVRNYSPLDITDPITVFIGSMPGHFEAIQTIVQDGTVLYDLTKLRQQKMPPLSPEILAKCKTREEAEARPRAEGKTRQKAAQAPIDNDIELAIALSLSEAEAAAEKAKARADAEAEAEKAKARADAEAEAEAKARSRTRAEIAQIFARTDAKIKEEIKQGIPYTKQLSDAMYKLAILEYNLVMAKLDEAKLDEESTQKLEERIQNLEEQIQIAKVEEVKARADARDEANARARAEIAQILAKTDAKIKEEIKQGIPHTKQLSEAMHKLAILEYNLAMAELDRKSTLKLQEAIKEAKQKEKEARADARAGTRAGTRAE